MQLVCLSSYKSHIVVTFIRRVYSSTFTTTIKLAVKHFKMHWPDSCDKNWEDINYEHGGCNFVMSKD